MTLRDLPVGKTATIRSVGGEGALRQHFLDMGLIPQGEVTVVNSPLPWAIRWICGFTVMN